MKPEKKTTSEITPNGGKEMEKQSTYFATDHKSES